MWKGMRTSQHWAVCNRCWPLFLGTHPMDHRNTCTVSLWQQKDWSTLVEFHGSVFISQGLWKSAWKSVWTKVCVFHSFYSVLFVHWQITIPVFILLLSEVLIFKLSQTCWHPWLYSKSVMGEKQGVQCFTDVGGRVFHIFTGIRVFFTGQFWRPKTWWNVCVHTMGDIFTDLENFSRDVKNMHGSFLEPLLSP